ncbi:MAG: hypothetical protein N3A66_06990, partial [Planctomycetota bacterium]|nr:hypothetical protein [Planctomycetota bacterium]
MNSSAFPPTDNALPRAPLRLSPFFWLIVAFALAAVGLGVAYYRSGQARGAVRNEIEKALAEAERGLDGGAYRQRLRHLDQA